MTNFKVIQPSEVKSSLRLVEQDERYNVQVLFTFEGPGVFETSPYYLSEG
jgi:hypothetical protein